MSKSERAHIRESNARQAAMAKLGLPQLFGTIDSVTQMQAQAHKVDLQAAVTSAQQRQDHIAALKRQMAAKQDN